MLDGCPAWPEELAAFYKENGCWEGKTFGELLRERARQFPDHVVVTEGEAHCTYEELDQRVDRLASGFQRIGLNKEDRVVVQLPNRTEFLEVIFALFRIGALPVFALPSHRSSEINYFCSFAEASAYIAPSTHEGFSYLSMAEGVRENCPTVNEVIIVGERSESFLSLEDLYQTSANHFPTIASTDVAFLQLSGGSTGLPKLIPRTHDDYMYSLRKSVEVCELDQNSVYLAVLPVAHNFPLSSPGILGVIYAGGRIVLAPNSSPDVAFPLLEKENVTITAVVPPIAMIWLEAVKHRSYDFSALRVLQVGGAKFSAESAKRVQPSFGCTLQQVFGMAEGLVNYTRLDDPVDTIVHTQGRPMSPFDQIRVVDEEDKEVETGQLGQLLTKGPYTIQGYYKAAEHNEKSFTSDGFYRTGDLVRVHESGNISVEGRAKDQINRGGEKIAAEEVENHLLAHPNVLDAAIVAMPDRFLGERSCAFIIPLHPEPTAEDCRKFLHNRGLAAYKIPDRIEIVDAFPQTALGKVSKKTLRHIIADTLKTTNHS